MSLEKVSWNDFLFALQNEIESIVALPTSGLTPEIIHTATDFQLEVLSAKSSREIQAVVEAEFQRRYPQGKPRNVLEETHRKETQFAQCLEAVVGSCCFVLLFFFI